ncbi:hypothetical protein Hanom_Chr14g01255361 [Helianthus anomalus]
MYFGISGASQPAQHAKLQTTFVSNTNPFIPTSEACAPTAYTFVPPPFIDLKNSNQQAYYGNLFNFKVGSTPNSTEFVLIPQTSAK